MVRAEELSFEEFCLLMKNKGRILVMCWVNLGLLVNCR